ncbi:MAG: chemotaxis protein CheC [Candidatus Omnitrophica bacterium]|nr:chemotaxis protein CheC [Candidatus Omnitrophota bacterium]
MKKNVFSAQQLDVLKEIGNICAGNATVALAQILFKKIELQIPTVEIISLKQIAKIIDKDDQPIIGIQMETLGAINGQILLVFSEKSAYTLMELLVGNVTQNKTRIITQIGISSLKEIGNIVISSYLSTLSSLSRLPVFPSCPQFTDGVPSSVIKTVFGGFGKDEPQVILIETVFSEHMSSVTGKFFIAFDSESMKLILKACETIANSAKKSHKK